MKIAGQEVSRGSGSKIFGENKEYRKVKQKGQEMRQQQRMKVMNDITREIR